MNINHWERPLITTILWYIFSAIIIIAMAAKHEFWVGPCSWGDGVMYAPLIFLISFILMTIAFFKRKKSRQYAIAAYIHEFFVLGTVIVFIALGFISK